MSRSGGQRQGWLKFDTRTPMFSVMELVDGPRTWTLETVVEALGPGPVSCWDPNARPLEIPEMLRRGTGLLEETDINWSQYFDGIFEEDRIQIALSWQKSLERPREVVRARIREKRSFAWWECDLIYLNLLGVDGIDCVLCAQRDVGAVDAPVLRRGPETGTATASAPVWQLQHLNELGIVLRAEGFSKEMVGLEPDEMVGQRTLDSVHPDDIAVVVSSWLELLKAPGATRTVTMRALHPDGDYRWYESMMTNRLDEPNVGAIVSVTYDIEDRRRKESAIRASERQFRTLAEEIPVAVFRTNAEGAITYANDLFRVTVGEVDHLRGLPAATADWWATVMVSDASEEVVFELGRKTLRLRGRAQREDVDPTDPRERAGAPKVEAIIGSVEDVTAAVVRERHLHTLAHTDALTGLANRRVLEQVVESALDAREEIIVIEADLDGFKGLNDDLGHHVGDLVLIEVARRLTSVVRPDDLVTRVGGDEFVVVCRSVGDDAIADLVRRVRQVISLPIADARDVSMAVSIGSARARPGDDLHALLRRADLAMYDDKRSRGHRR